ncbi:MAG: 3-deoxy-8-phosphooctulonate synthase [Bdellovibrionales bacterium]|nr:3-deoxy-8-phosphooctulonate synthase [Bdellovibrionales bacterium]
MRSFEINEKIIVGKQNPLLIIAGPCQIESYEHCLKLAETIQEECAKRNLNFIFKSSFDKANRTSLSGVRGPGIEEGLEVLSKLKKQAGLSTITDIHLPEQANLAAEVVDILQIPAFLCRQTDLLLAAGSTDKPINIKKGQFLHPEDMKHVISKVISTGNEKILLCERGTLFGYRDLVVDPRGILIMKETSYPVVFDATHSVQVMGGSNGSSGGNKQFIIPLICSAVSLGVDALFIECHENPDKAPSDGASMLPLELLPKALDAACAMREAYLSINL